MTDHSLCRKKNVMKLSWLPASGGVCVNQLIYYLPVLRWLVQPNTQSRYEWTIAKRSHFAGAKISTRKVDGWHWLLSATEFVRSVGRCTFQNDSAHSFLNSWRDIRIQPPAREPTTVICIFLSEIQRQNKNKTNCKPTQHLSYREYDEVLPLTYTCRQRSNTHAFTTQSFTHSRWLARAAVLASLRYYVRGRKKIARNIMKLKIFLVVHIFLTHPHVSDDVRPCRRQPDICSVTVLHNWVTFFLRVEK